MQEFRLERALQTTAKLELKGRPHDGLNWKYFSIPQALHPGVKNFKRENSDGIAAR